MAETTTPTDNKVHENRGGKRQVGSDRQPTPFKKNLGFVSTGPRKHDKEVCKTEWQKTGAQRSRREHREITERSIQLSLGNPAARGEITQRSQRDHRETTERSFHFSKRNLTVRGEITQRSQRDHREITAALYGECAL